MFSSLSIILSKQLIANLRIIFRAILIRDWWIGCITFPQGQSAFGKLEQKLIVWL